MSKYLTNTEIAELDKFKDEMYKSRSAAKIKLGIDLLDTDALSSIAIYNIVSKYDPDYNVNFSRNDEDAISNNIIIEQKCSKIKKSASSAVFMFHAMGTLNYPRYIFVVRREDNLELIRIYDIAGIDNVKLIQDHLSEESRKWLEKGRIDPTKMKYDVISISETFLKSIIFNEQTIDGCIIKRA